jgi:hypothetical protein
MEWRDATTQEQVYRPRNPRASPLYRCVCKHADELRDAGHIHRLVEDETLDRFLDCGDLHKGFAWVHCDTCGRGYLRLLSYKTRCFCLSCHQKRMLIYGEWVEEEVLAPVPQRRLPALARLPGARFRRLSPPWQRDKLRAAHRGAGCRRADPAPPGGLQPPVTRCPVWVELGLQPHPQRCLLLGAKESSARASNAYPTT